MTGEERRNKIVQIMTNDNEPLSGTKLAKRMQVSRQVIVQDIALLRANGMDIISTNRGYMIGQKGDVKRVFKMIHGDDEVETELNPDNLLGSALGIEAGLGRVRVIKNGPRIIDIDVLLYGDECKNSETLILPISSAMLSARHLAE